ncbi:hypothetical protein AB0K51_06035 [Kitasatospora sp. NPDC049285]|uniref:hypothetical protein n=1 Tax=Kitasatospora sp. NPDC049285 TaxID=3157096 RepID=UPI0034142E9D
MTELEQPAVPGPRHAVPRESVRSRLRGKALAMAAVPTALLVGAAYAPTLAMAETPTGKCASTPDAVLKETPVPKSQIKVLPDSGTSVTRSSAQQAPAGSAAAVPAVFTGAAGTVQSAVYTTPNTPAASGAVQPAGLIDDLLGGLLHPGGTPTPTPSPTPSTKAATPSATASAKPPATPAPPVTGQSSATPAAGGAAPSAASSASVAGSARSAAKPTASASASVGPNCQLDTRHVAALAAPKGDVVPDQNWVLHSTRLSLHGSVFNGVYDVTTESGTKRVLKFTTDSVDIENLDMSTIQVQGLTFHVKSREGSTSTMRNGPVTMYVESLSGHLAAIYGLPIPIDLGPITLTPDTLPKWLWDLLGAVPIPLDLTLTDAKAVQAGQFGGDLKIPGMRLFNDKTPYDG